MSNYEKTHAMWKRTMKLLYLIFIHNRTRKVTRCTSVLRTWESLHSRETNEHIYSNGTYIHDIKNCNNIRYLSPLNFPESSKCIYWYRLELTRAFLFLIGLYEVPSLIYQDGNHPWTFYITSVAFWLNT